MKRLVRNLGLWLMGRRCGAECRDERKHDGDEGSVYLNEIRYAIDSSGSGLMICGGGMCTLTSW
jgi:hypothetical protein